MKLTYQPGRPGNHILLFFKPYEVDRFVPGDRYLKRLVRPLYNRLHRRQKVTGFGVSFDLMRRALTGAGFIVHCNDRALARANPDYPVGLVGGRALLAEWRLPNPAILGPSLYDQPGEAPRLFEDPRFHTYVCLSDWTREMFEQGYPGRCASWFAGIDMQAWPDLSGEPKDLDFIIYDKVHWDRRHYEAALIAPIRDELDARGLTHETLRYGEYDHAMFRALLKRARGLVWLSENETQGLAYQEAMASGVPVLAWDRGYWADPQWREHFETPPRASSVPFFSDACGERFACVDEFAARLADFLRRRDAYRPRNFVAQDLSPAASAQLYASAYFAALDGQSATS